MVKKKSKTPRRIPNSYHCQLCKRRHLYSSRVGAEHWPYTRSARMSIREYR